MTLASELGSQLGLRRHSTYDEIVRSFRQEPGVPYPDRLASKLEKSAVCGQLKDALRTFSSGEAAWADYQQHGGGGLAQRRSFHLARDSGEATTISWDPRPPRRGPVEEDEEDELMGPPGANPDLSGNLLEPMASNQFSTKASSPLPPHPPCQSNKHRLCSSRLAAPSPNRRAKQ